MAQVTPEHNTFLEWLSSQWFWLVALVTGATHAANAQSKISKHEEQLKKFDDVPERLAKIETHQEHILEILRKRG
jgi:hypothetical protein